jgi:hypothetical protein
MWAVSSSIASAIICKNGAVIEYGYYSGIGGGTSQRVFKVTGTTTPGPIFRYNTIIAAGTTPYSIDRLSSEVNGVLVVYHNTFPVLAVSTSLVPTPATIANGFNYAGADVVG